MKKPNILQASLQQVGIDADALRQKFLECLSRISTHALLLRTVVRKLIESGVTWRRLTEWAVSAGYEDRYVRKLLSEVLLDIGIRRRRPGAGPRTPQEALLILAFARENYGDRAGKFLRAAYRAARAQELAQPGQQQPA